MRKCNTLTSVLLVQILAITYCIYQPGVRGGFTFDDFPNIIQNDALKLTELNLQDIRKSLFAGDSGPLGRPISMLSFALNYYLGSGFNPYYFKQVNIFIHLINGVGVYWLSYLLLTSHRRICCTEAAGEEVFWPSLAVAAAWVWHPLNLTSVLYVVQRMTSLSAFFQITGLILYCYGRLSLVDGRSRRGITTILAGLLFTVPAILAKENGILVPFYFAAVEISIFRLAGAKSSDIYFTKAFFSIFCLMPVIAAIGFLIFRIDWLLGGYEGREFSLVARLLTEARVLCYYVYLITVPNIQEMGLFHDDIQLSEGLLSPVTTPLSVFAILSAFILAWTKRRGHPFFLLGVLGYLIGHSLESSIIPLEIAHEHRNYLPQFFIILSIGFYVHRILVKTVGRRTVRYALVVFTLSVLPLSTWVRADAWGQPVDLIVTEAANHPASAITQFEAGSLYAKLLLSDPERKEEFFGKSRQYFEKSLEHHPRFLASLFGLLVLSSRAGHPVEPFWIADLEKGLRNNPISANTLTAMVEFAKCYRKGGCQIPQAEIGRLFQAAIDNPMLQGRSRALVLSCASDHLFLVVKNYEDALRLAYWATESDPNEIQYRMNLINMLILVDQRELAKAQIEIVRKMDAMNIHIGKINELAAML